MTPALSLKNKVFPERAIFGLAAVFVGIVAFAARSKGTVVSPEFGAILRSSLALAQVAGGIALLSPRTVRAGALVLSVAYIVISLFCIPPILSAPSAYVTWGNLFERLALACGAISAFAQIEASAAHSEVVRRVARIGLGLCAVSFAFEQIVYLQPTALLVPAWIPPSPTFWVILTTIAFACAALAALTNWHARLGLQLLALMLTLFNVLVWIPILVARPSSYRHWGEFAETCLIAASALVISKGSDSRSA